jgi:hypothetical protein
MTDYPYLYLNRKTAAPVAPAKPPVKPGAQTPLPAPKPVAPPSSRRLPYLMREGKSLWNPSTWIQRRQPEPDAEPDKWLENADKFKKDTLQKFDDGGQKGLIEKP